MRKRAQMKSRPLQEEPKHYAYKPSKTISEKKPKLGIKKNWWIAIALIGIFFIVLLHNTYYNADSDLTINPEGEGFEKFYLSGPDPYYNMRIVEGIYDTGSYPYYTEPDPLLNYPDGSRGSRPPLFNMMAMGFSRFLAPFMDEVDAVGFSMQFIPALFGALLIFPVYFIGKTLFGKKTGLVAAFFISIIPIHLASGHGSAYSLFDHDSFNLLLYMVTFLFLILAIKEKDSTKSILYALLSGIGLAALSMTWVEARFLYVVIAVYAVVQMIIDIFTNKIDSKVFRTTSVVLLSGYLISFPVMYAEYGEFNPDLTFFLTIAIVGFGFVYYLFGKKNIPWTISMPAIFGVGAFGLIFLYFIEDLASNFSFLSPFRQLSGILFGTGGIYGNKVSMTIAEANTYQISQSVMSFGPAIYWIGWAGLLFTCYLFYKQKLRRDYLFVIVLFFINLWLVGTAGRFLNDMVPWIAILAGWVIIIAVTKLDYKQMLRNIKSAGGGIHGVRRGVKLMHVFGILFIAFIVILPNAFIAFDAAIPNKTVKDEEDRWVPLKEVYFGEDHSGAYGLGIVKERYWGDAFEWLSQQDTHIERDVDRPAFISWWDYGFYEVALGGHPTVADNFQDGIPTAANFHTATSEQEAVVVWITRLLEGSKNSNMGQIPDEIKGILVSYVGESDAENIERWILDPSTTSFHDKPIGFEYDQNLSKEYRVDQQYGNSLFHQMVDYFVKDDSTKLSDEDLTLLYHDIQNATGWSIRYYGVEGYDKQIFNIFGFLSDKSILLVGAPEDDFTQMLFTGKMYYKGSQDVEREFVNEPLQTYFELSDDEKQRTIVDSTPQQRKDLYYDTMFYKTYFGPAKNTGGELSETDFQFPCLNMKHFYAEFISDMSRYQYYDTGKAAVVIAKYYEGAIIEGSILFDGSPVNNTEVAIYKDLTYAPDFSSQIDHDKKLIVLEDEDDEASFSLLAGAGSTLQIRRYPELVHPELGLFGFEIKNITFDDESDPLFKPISDDDAMRISDNYIRNIGNITIEPGNIDGYIYNDLDGVEGYNASEDDPLNDVNIVLYDILEFDEQQFIESYGQTLSPLNAPAIDSLFTNETGHYGFSNLLPGFYAVNVFEGDYLIHSEIIDVKSGNKSYDIAKPMLSELEGTVYYDEDGGEYPEGEAISDALVELFYVKPTDQTGQTQISAGNYTSDNDGSYEFDSLLPGSYIIRAVKGVEYKTEQEITIKENETKIFNVSMDLYPATLTGNLLSQYDEPVKATILFEPDESEEDNTAVETSIESASDGSYSIDITPGLYNVTVNEFIDSITAYELDDGKITIGQGIGSITKDFTANKKSVTVTGTTTYAGVEKNATLSFTPDTTVSNNTAITLFEKFSTGSYSAELNPGTYNVAVESNMYDEDGVNYTYSGKFTISEEDIEDGYTYNVALIVKDE